MNIVKLAFGIFAGTLACVGAQGAEHKVFSRVDLGKLPPPAAKKDLDYAKDIRPLFEASCIRCHGQDRPKAGLRLDSLQGVLKGGEDKVVTPNNSAHSLLVVAAAQLDEETAMPPKKRPGRGGPGGPNGGPGGTNGPAGPGQGQGPGRGGPPAKPLTADEVGLVRAWIDQGAK